MRYPEWKGSFRGAALTGSDHWIRKPHTPVCHTAMKCNAVLKLTRHLHHHITETPFSFYIFVALWLPRLQQSCCTFSLLGAIFLAKGGENFSISSLNLNMLHYDSFKEVEGWSVKLCVEWDGEPDWVRPLHTWSYPEIDYSAFSVEDGCTFFLGGCLFNQLDPSLLMNGKALRSPSPPMKGVLLKRFERCPPHPIQPNT